MRRRRQYGQVWWQRSLGHWNSGWAVVVVVALVIVALFGYWAIEGDFERGGDTARIESDVNVNRGAPAQGTDSTSETNLDVDIDRDQPAERTESRSQSRLEADIDVEGEPAARSESRSETRLEVERERSQ